jgi:hypothetical protein
VQWVVGAEDKAEVFCADQVFGDAEICEPEFRARIRDVSAQDVSACARSGLDQTARWINLP